MFALSRISQRFGRNVMSKMIRNESNGGVPGENLPFNIHNKRRLTLIFTLFTTSGLAVPFLIVEHQLRKKVS